MNKEWVGKMKTIRRVAEGIAPEEWLLRGLVELLVESPVWP